MDQKTLTNLIERSQSGDQAAIEDLLRYAHTSVSYQCRKLLKNPQDAEDVTQEVLLTVYTKLDTLREPAAFMGWLNHITANRCMNALTRGRKELQFEEDEEGHSLLDSLEELDEQQIPDKALDNAETARMIEELVDALPEAQRMSVLLYYYDEMSVSQIAKVMSTSENTVKSRLNYARKSIKEGVLDYEKKGVKLYSVSVLPFLLYFLRKAAESSADPAAAQAAAEQVMAAGAATAAAGAAGSAASGASAGSAASAAGAGAAAGGAAAGISAKVIAGILAGIIAVGGAAAGVTAFAGREAPDVPSAAATQAEDIQPTAETEETVPPTTEAAVVEKFVPVEDAMFPELLQGNLTKEQLSYFLWIAPKSYSGEELSVQTLEGIVMWMVKGCEDLGIANYGYDSNWNMVISTADTNRVLSVLTDYQFTEENHPNMVQGDNLAMVTAGGSGGCVEILSAEYKSDEMRIVYKYVRAGLGPDPSELQFYAAVLKPNEAGRFQITGIGAVTDLEVVAQLAGTEEWRLAYEQFLVEVGNQTYTDEASGLAVSPAPSGSYCLYDTDGDGIPELILRMRSGWDFDGMAGILPPRTAWFGIYSFRDSQVELLYQSTYDAPSCAVDENTGKLIVYTVNTLNGDAAYYTICWEKGDLREKELYSGQISDLGELDAFNERSGFVDLEFSVPSDLRPLDNY